MGRILKKARECKHSVEEVRTGDAAVHMPRSKAIWTTCGNQGGNGVQFKRRGPGRDGENAFAISLFQKSDLEDSINRFTENYPSSSDVRNIYQNMVNFLQIAIGNGYEQSYDFEFEKFCSKYQLNKYKCIKALNILEKDNLIKYNSYNNSPSSVHVICNSKSIINYKSPNAKKSELLQLILRLYPGVFDNPAEIKERNLAIQLNLKSNDINKILNKVEK